MARLKERNLYFFSVGGETEYWYLKWLENIINKNENSTHKVSIKCEVQSDPVKYIKKLTVFDKTVVYHLADYESDESIHVQQFYTTMDRMKQASSQKQVIYKFGYSNLTFDLWIILHMANCNVRMYHRDNYIKHLNRAYSESFESMGEYKHENNFKRCLGKLQIPNVINAINRAKGIMQRNKENGYTLHQYKGYKYYKENPSLTIWEAIEKILKDCGLM
jgi:hypothetical protein